MNDRMKTAVLRQLQTMYDDIQVGGAHIEYIQGKYEATRETLSWFGVGVEFDSYTKRPIGLVEGNQ